MLGMCAALAIDAPLWKVAEACSTPAESDPMALLQSFPSPIILFMHSTNVFYTFTMARSCCRQEQQQQQQCTVMYSPTIYFPYSMYAPRISQRTCYFILFHTACPRNEASRSVRLGWTIGCGKWIFQALQCFFRSKNCICVVIKRPILAISFASNGYI